MTHAQALKIDVPDDPDELASEVRRVGLCLGELAPLSSHPHTTMEGPTDSARIVERTVTVHLCTACGRVLSIDDTGQVLNEYRPVKPRDVVRELARAFDVKPMLPTTEEL